MPTTLRCRDKILDLATPAVMGILNATPDSFYADSRLAGSPQEVLDRAGRMVEEGATVLDVGGMSTRPGAEEVPASMEAERVLPVIEAIVSAFPSVIVSVDTFRTSVARQALAAGAGLVNDVSGFSRDPDLPGIVALHQAGYVLMHMRGTPKTMQQMTDYADVVADVLRYFADKLRILRQAEVHDVLMDPGFGFAKTPVQNYQLIERLRTFRLLGCPLLVGVSRKSTIARTIGRPTEETLTATTALHMVALRNGASVLRVHDVRPAIEAIRIHQALMEASMDASTEASGTPETIS